MSEQPVPETRGPQADRLERAAPWSPIWPCSGWGLPCLVDYSSSGGLLPHLFTLTAGRASGGLFSVALSVNPVSGTARVYRQQSARSRERCWVTRHRALWSSDFPPRPAEADRSDSPPFQNPAESISRLAKVYKGDSLSGGDDIESKLHHLGSIGGGRFREPLSRATSQRSTGENVRGTQTQPIGKGARISGAARRAGWNEELLKNTHTLFTKTAHVFGSQCNVCWNQLFAFGRLAHADL